MCVCWGGWGCGGCSALENREATGVLYHRTSERIPNLQCYPPPLFKKVSLAPPRLGCLGTERDESMEERLDKDFLPLQEESNSKGC